MVYSYKHGFSGFAAKLTESQAQMLSGTICIPSWAKSKTRKKSYIFHVVSLMKCTKGVLNCIIFSFGKSLKSNIFHLHWCFIYTSFPRNNWISFHGRANFIIKIFRSIEYNYKMRQDKNLIAKKKKKSCKTIQSNAILFPCRPTKRTLNFLLWL